MITMREKLAELLEQYGGPPVNIEAVIRGLGVELDKKATLASDISGQIERTNDNNYRVSVNVADNYMRQRFTMAHELGHFLLHKGLIGDGLTDDRAYRSTDVGVYRNPLVGEAEEAAANRVAARVLMPADKVRQEAQDYRSVEALAKRFQVSKRAMEIRLQTLGIEL